MNISIKLASFALLLQIFVFSFKNYPSYRLFHRNRVIHTRQQTKDTKLGAKFNCDVVVVGAGIAGRSIASYLQMHEKIDTIIVDSQLGKPWVPNYGVWEDEWNEISSTLKFNDLYNCVEKKWSKTNCFFPTSIHSNQTEIVDLKTGYVKIDKNMLRLLLEDNFESSGGRSLVTSVHNVTRCNEDSYVVSTTSGDSIESRLVIDTSGFNSKFTKYRSDECTARFFQIAYGMEALVDNLGPFDIDQMTLFDMSNSTDMSNTSSDSPTFMYVMPLQKYDNGSFRVFFEETMLIQPANRLHGNEIDECHRRCLKRLEHYGIKPLQIISEEQCRIPMGGLIPAKSGQHVLPFGAAANLIHPATGYHCATMLSLVPKLSKLIATSIKRNRIISIDKLLDFIWSPRRHAIYRFQLLGAQFLSQCDAMELAMFMKAFFSLPKELWIGYLSETLSHQMTMKSIIWYWRTLSFIVKLGIRLDMYMLKKLLVSVFDSAFRGIQLST